MSKFISKLAFCLVSYNFIIAVILITKFVLQYAVVGVLLLIEITVVETYVDTLGVVLTLIASLASIIIGIMFFIIRGRIWLEKIKRIQTINALFVVIIMALIALILSPTTLFLLTYVNT